MQKTARAIAEIPCAIIVAYAAPPTPMLNGTIKIISRIILITADIARNISGIVELPRLRIIPAK